MSTEANTPVAITGMGAITALGPSVDALHAGLLNSERALSPYSGYGTDLAYPVGAVKLDTELHQDRTMVLAQHAATEAIRDAGWPDEVLRSPRTIVVVATTKAGFNVAERIMEGRVDPEHAQQAFLFALAARLREAMGVGGPAFTISVACASGIVAVGHARYAIQRGDADRALVVGADALCNFIFRGFATLQALDPNGARPFDVARAGLSVGEGAAAVTLEAGAGGFEVMGFGASNDANHITGPARDGRGLVAALEGSLDEAGVAREAIGFGLLHGTATRYNDAMESIAYRRVFGARALPTLGIKGAIGHTMGAAGLANLVVAARSLRAKQVPPCVGVQTLDEEIELDLVMDAPRAVASPWAMISASGFAGVNAAMVIRLSEGTAESPVQGAPSTDAALDRRATTAIGAPASAADDRRAASFEPAAAADLAVVTAQVDIPPERAPAVKRIGSRSARRRDDLCVLGVAATDVLLAESGLAPEALAAAPHGLVLGTALGALESEHGYYVREIHPEQYDPSPRLFAYTLPNIVLGETAIRFGLLGENLVLSAGRASGFTALLEANRRVQAGIWARALVLVVDAVGPVTKQLMEHQARYAPGVVSAWLIERASVAAARQARPLGHLDGRFGPHDMGDLAQPARVVGPKAVDPGSEPLGGAGMAELVASVSGGRPATIRVECPSGYAAELSWQPVSRTKTR